MWSMTHTEKQKYIYSHIHSQLQNHSVSDQWCKARCVNVNTNTHWAGFIAHISEEDIAADYNIEFLCLLLQ